MFTSCYRLYYDNEKIRSLDVNNLILIVVLSYVDVLYIYRKVSFLRIVYHYQFFIFVCRKREWFYH